MKETSVKERNARKDLLKHYMEILGRKLSVLLDGELKVFTSCNTISNALEIVHPELNGAICIITPKYLLKGGLVVEIFTGMKTPDRDYETILFSFSEGSLEEARMQDLLDTIKDILQRKIFYVSCDMFDDNDALQESERELENIF